MSTLHDSAFLEDNFSLKKPEDPMFNGLSGKFFAGGTPATTEPEAEDTALNGLSRALFLDGSDSSTPEERAMVLFARNSDLSDSFTRMQLLGPNSNSLLVSYVTSMMESTSMAAKTLASYFQGTSAPPKVKTIKPKKLVRIVSLPKRKKITSTPLCQVENFDQEVLDTSNQSVYALPSAISFKESSFQTAKVQTVTLFNEGFDAATFRVCNYVTYTKTPYDPDVYTYVTALGNDKAKIEFSEQIITVNPGKSKTIAVRIVPPTAYTHDYLIYNGYIQFAPINSNRPPLHVPYSGVIENQQDFFNTFTFYDERQEHNTNSGRKDSAPQAMDPNFSSFDYTKEEETSQTMDLDDIIEFDEPMVLNFQVIKNNHRVIASLNTSQTLESSLIYTPYISPPSAPPKTFTELSNPYEYQYWSTIPSFTTIQLLYNIGILLLVQLKYFNVL